MTWMDLLMPGIRAALFRYGSMREVTFYPHPTDRALCVRYTLITDESRTIEIPRQLFAEGHYEEIIERVTHYLGALPA